MKTIFDILLISLFVLRVFPKYLYVAQVSIMTKLDDESKSRGEKEKYTSTLKIEVRRKMLSGSDTTHTAKTVYDDAKFNELLTTDYKMTIFMDHIHIFFNKELKLRVNAVEPTLGNSVAKCIVEYRNPSLEFTYKEPLTSDSFTVTQIAEGGLLNSIFGDSSCKAVNTAGVSTKSPLKTGYFSFVSDKVLVPVAISVAEKDFDKFVQKENASWFEKYRNSSD